MGKRRLKRRRKKPSRKRARAKRPLPAITAIVSDIVRTLTEKKFGARLAKKRSPPSKRKKKPGP